MENTLKKNIFFYHGVSSWYPRDFKIATLKPSQIRTPKSTACKSSEETNPASEAIPVPRT